MKRIVFIVLTIIAFASLSACGSNSNTTVDNAERELNLRLKNQLC